MSEHILEHYQLRSYERFRVFQKREMAMTAIILLSFLAYPSPRRMAKRQDCADALQAWLIRRTHIEDGIKLEPFARLRRADLSPREVRSRIFKASRRIQFHAMPVADIAYEIYWRKIGGYRLMGQFLGAAFKAKNVQLTIPKTFCTETAVIRAYLKQHSPTVAQFDMRSLLENFRSREWREYLPAVPLLLALDKSVLGWDPIRAAYSLAIPGYPKRFLAISLLRNPQIWVPNVLQWTAMWHQLLKPHFKNNVFAEVLGEEAEPSLGVGAMGAFFDGLAKRAA